MKKFIIAFWDMLAYLVISIPLSAQFLYYFFNSEDLNFMQVIFYSFCLAIVVWGPFFLQHTEIDLSRDYVNPYYMTSWGPKNNLDLQYNWEIFPSEIEKVSLVKLSKEEKKKYTSSKFLFSKYLKIELRYGAVKYVYVSHYTNFQIKKIIRLLTSNLYKNTKIAHRN
ncbi:MAG: hypothetical protein J6M34_07530 [Clostridia bacterium]|nr:hypothetical protein [Clostridia bacterium]